MKTKVISLSDLDFPNKKFIHLKTEDQRLCFCGLVDFYPDRVPKIHGVSKNKSKESLSLVHTYLSKELLKYHFVSRVSFFWRGIEILLEDDHNRHKPILSLKDHIKIVFPEEDVEILPPT